MVIFHNRRIINGENALALEISKSLQYKKLNEQNIKTPKSIFCSGKANILSAADHFTKPFITKHNRAGRGLGVKLFQNKIELEKYVNGGQFEDSIDGITILQDYIEADPKVVTRVEFINSNFIMRFKWMLVIALNYAQLMLAMLKRNFVQLIQTAINL